MSDRDDWQRFGAAVRAAREQRGLSLRYLARILDLSPTYLSKVETGISTPPTAERCIEIAQVLGLQVDRLLALAGRVAPDIIDIYRRAPAEIAALARAVDGMTREEIAQLTAMAKAGRKG